MHNLSADEKKIKRQLYVFYGLLFFILIALFAYSKLQCNHPNRVTDEYGNVFEIIKSKTDDPDYQEK